MSIYAYMDLSSVRSYDGGRAAVGVSYEEAKANGWLALDVNGNPIEWNGYPGHYQAAVWNPGYQRAWIARAQEVLASGFDGILADNAMSTLSHYSSAWLTGTSSAAQTDEQIRAGITQLIQAAGPAVSTSGGALVPNISDGRLSQDTWNEYSTFGGGMEENFMTWSTGNSTQPELWDYNGGGWNDQASLIGSGPSSLAVTHILPGDNRSAVYGYSSFLMYADPGDAWTLMEYGKHAPVDLKEQSYTLGAPTGAATTSSNGIRTRTFTAGWAAVNPTQTSLTVTAPAGVVDSDGNPLGTITLQPMSGVVGQS